MAPEQISTYVCAVSALPAHGSVGVSPYRSGVITNQTAALRIRSDFSAAEDLAAKVLAKSPGLRAEVHCSPAGWSGKPFASIVFSIDYGPYWVDWRVHRKVVQLALDTAGVAERFEPLR
jgi:hypothetical protein